MKEITRKIIKWFKRFFINLSEEQSKEISNNKYNPPDL